MDLGDHAEQLRLLIRDPKGKFTAAFDVVFVGVDIRIIRAPIRAAAKRDRRALDWHVRHECLDQLLITGPRHLAAVLREFIERYNTDRPHRSLDQHPPADPTAPTSGATVRPLRRDRLGGLFHEYLQVA
jgi:putative transposase